MSNRDIESVLLALANGTSTCDWEPTPGDRLAQALGRFLDDSSSGDSVYDSPAAFEAFIDGAGNVSLYQRTIALLTDRLAQLRPARLADIGCGDGRVTHESRPASARVIDLVEPSPVLLDQAASRPWPATTTIRCHEVDVEQFLATNDVTNQSTSDATWDVVQSTFALHNLSPDRRQAVLGELAGRTSELLIVEFDIPAFDDRSAEHAAYVVERYRRGIDDYADNDLVIQGFLMPVLVGQFDPTRPRVTWEQPIAQWVDDLGVAGFTAVTTVAVRDYWWASASLIHARR